MRFSPLFLSFVSSVSVVVAVVVSYAWISQILTVKATVEGGNLFLVPPLHALITTYHSSHNPFFSPVQSYVVTSPLSLLSGCIVNMGACLSSAGGIEISEQDKALHRQAEKELKAAQDKMVRTHDRLHLQDTHPH